MTCMDLLLSSPLCSAVKRQLQLQVAEVLSIFSSASKMNTLSVELAQITLFLKQDSSARLMSAEDGVAITRCDHLLKLWSWYEISFLKLVAEALLGSTAVKELNQFVKTRADSLQYMFLPECFPHGPLTADKLTPPPGYTPLRLTLPNHPRGCPHGSSVVPQGAALLLPRPAALRLAAEGLHGGKHSHHLPHLTTCHT